MEQSALDRPWCSARSISLGWVENVYTSSIPTYMHTYTHTHILMQTPQSATWLARKMSCDGHAVALITGVSTIEQRITVLNR